MAADNTITITQENPGPVISQFVARWEQGCRETGQIRMVASQFLAALRQDPTMKDHAENFDLEVPESATIWVTGAEFLASVDKAELKIVVRY